MWNFMDIEYSNIAVNFDRFRVDFDARKQIVKVDFPLLQSFEMHARYHFKSYTKIIKKKGNCTVKVGNMELRGNFHEKVYKSGFPKLYVPFINFYIGHSSFDLHND